jgi:hypothetical protein
MDTALPPRAAIISEYGPLYTLRNVARIPGDGGSYIDLRNLAGRNNASNASRVQVEVPMRRGTFRLYYAPLSIKGQGTLDNASTFKDETFASGVQTDVLYEFRSYRITYRQPWKTTGGWHLDLGGTMKVRDATISLRQPTVSAAEANIGWVPLVHVSGVKRLSHRASMSFDLDALGGGPGRAIDLGIRANYNIGNDYAAGIGVRTIEGGADVPRVFNFAWFATPVLTLTRLL